MAGYPYAYSWCLELDYPLNVENVREALGRPRSQPPHVVVGMRNAVLRAIDAGHYWNLIKKRLLIRWRQRVVAWLRVYGPRAMALLPPVPDDGDP